MTDVTHLLRANIADYLRQRDDAAQRLAMEQGRASPDKKKVARLHRSVAFHQRQMDNTLQQLGSFETESREDNYV